MFDLGALGEILLIIVAALILFGPKEIPQLVCFVGRWAGKARRFTRQLQRSMDDVINEAEIEDFKDSAHKDFKEDIQKNLEELDKDE